MAQARPESNDGGVDVVVWRSFADQRPGFLVILGQGTIGSQWRGKERDITEPLWGGFIDFGRDPIVAFGIPQVIPASYDYYDQIRRTVHLVFDRIRLCESLAGAELTRRTETEEWVGQELERLRQGP